MEEERGKKSEKKWEKRKKRKFEKKMVEKLASKCRKNCLQTMDRKPGRGDVAVVSFGLQGFWFESL
jgi:hypothetical protein